MTFFVSWAGYDNHESCVLLAFGAQNRTLVGYHAAVFSCIVYLGVFYYGAINSLAHFLLVCVSFSLNHIHQHTHTHTLHAQTTRTHSLSFPSFVYPHLFLVALYLLHI